jgi:hypothetical protein
MSSNSRKLRLTCSVRPRGRRPEKTLAKANLDGTGAHKNARRRAFDRVLQQLAEERPQFVDFEYSKLAMNQAPVAVQHHGERKRGDSIAHALG